MIRTTTIALLLVSTLGLRAESKQAVVAHYAELVHASYVDSLTTAQALQAAIAVLVEAPSAEALAAAKQAWLAAREPYGQTEAYRFYAGPIDDEDGPEGLLNAWPLDEGYIDYTVDGHGGGIVADAAGFPEITAEILAQLNEQDGDANISTGYHAIEFLLWGQDLSADGPGARPVTDYADDPLADRRKAYLTAATDKLIADLRSMVDAWAPGAANYRASFESDGASLGKIIVGVGSLSGGELAGERMAVALENKDQEDEHSCFSDNTHRDIATNQQGIANIWSGRYVRPDGSAIEGPGLRALVAAEDASLAAEVDAAVAAVSAAIAEIPAPFDRAIVDEVGRAQVQAAIDALWLQTRLMPKVAKALEVEAAIEGL